MEEFTPDSQTKEAGQFKRWFQDNLRIIVSVVVVIVIAGGIYSYSKRGATPIVSDSQQQVAGDETTADTAKDSTVDATANTKEVSSVASSKETENSFVETAGKKDGLTVLARRAAADYLEKNPDSSLTKEHKIYIEDYLRKNVGQKGHVKIGTSVEFSKDLIQKAIEQSKKLNDRQLKNLQKYSARVSSL